MIPLKPVGGSRSTARLRRRSANPGRRDHLSDAERHSARDGGVRRRIGPVGLSQYDEDRRGRLPLPSSKPRNLAGVAHPPPWRGDAAAHARNSSDPLEGVLRPNAPRMAPRARTAARKERTQGEFRGARPSGRRPGARGLLAESPTPRRFGKELHEAGDAVGRPLLRIQLRNFRAVSEEGQPPLGPHEGGGSAKPDLA